MKQFEYIFELDIGEIFLTNNFPGKSVIVFTKQVNQCTHNFLNIDEIKVQTSRKAWWQYSLHTANKYKFGYFYCQNKVNKVCFSTLSNFTISVCNKGGFFSNNVDAFYEKNIYSTNLSEN